MQKKYTVIRAVRHSSVRHPGSDRMKLGIQQDCHQLRIHSTQANCSSELLEVTRSATMWYKGGLVGTHKLVYYSSHDTRKMLRVILEYRSVIVFLPKY